jgi:hypothetical protein
VVEYLSGNRIQGSSTLTTEVPKTAWEEIGRYTVTGSSTDSFTVRGLASATSGTMVEKDMLMLLMRKVPSGATRNRMHFNDDNGTSDNYIQYTNSQDGNGNWKIQNKNEQAYISLDLTGGADDDFIYGKILNKAGHRYGSLHVTRAYTSADDIYMRDKNFKYFPSSSSARITKINFDNSSGSGEYGIGTEVVVLGMNFNQVEASTQFWDLLYEKELTGSQTETNFTTDTWTPKKYMWLEYGHNCSTDPVVQVGVGGTIQTGSYRQASQQDDDAPALMSRSNLEFTSNPKGFQSVMFSNPSDRYSIGSARTSGVNSPYFKACDGVWYGGTGQINKYAINKGSNPTFSAPTWIKVWGHD